MARNRTELSKFLSYVLRHKPQSIGLVLDDEGWAKIDDIIDKSNKKLSLELIEEVVANCEKQRFALSPDGQRIRANQGHSVKIDLRLTPKEPPEHLYHGTASRFLQSIKAKGLLPGNRQYVHLSVDLNTATKVGQRHGKVVLLQIPAGEMHRAGHTFYRAENNVWLTTHIPADKLEEIEAD